MRHLFRATLLIVAKTGLLGPPVFAADAVQARVTVYPAPEGIQPSPFYTVEAAGKPVFVYTANTLHGGPASFIYFDMSGEVRIKVTVPGEVRTAAIRPTPANIKPEITGKEIAFTLKEPRNLSLELNGSSDRPLLIFASPPEENPPKKGDPNVIYFGPGIHEVGGTTKIPSNTTVYIAGGAIVRGKLLPEEKPVVERNWAGQKEYQHLFVAENAANVTVRGRGILDGSALPWHAKCPLFFSNCKNFLVEGIVVTDSPGWNMPCFGCQGGKYLRVRQIAHRENSDGINICNSQDITVDGCFLRNNDDEICLKTPSPPPALENKNIVVKNCVIWNDRALAIGITYETRANISNALFKDCDIIHDTGIGAITIHVSDSGTISNIRFEDIRVEETRSRFVRFWIGADMWGKDPNRGHIKDVVFKNVSLTGANFPGSELTGFNNDSCVENVVFDNLRIQGKHILSAAEGRFSLRNAKDIRFSADDTPPKEAPQINRLDAVQNDRVELAWTAVADPESGIRNYRVYRNNEKIAEVPGTAFEDPDTRENTVYTYTVSAVNLSLLEGPKGPERQIKTPADTFPPRVLGVVPLLGEPLRLSVQWSEAVEKTSAENAGHYSLKPAGTIQGATLAEDGRALTLTVAGLTGPAACRLSIRNVRDRSAKSNAIPETETAFQLESDLAGCWPLDNVEAEKTPDCSGEGHDGLVVWQPAKAAGAQNQALSFDPAQGEQYVEIPAAGRLQNVEKGSYTLMAFFKPLSAPPGKDADNNAAYGIVIRTGYHLGLVYNSNRQFAMTHWLQGDKGAGAGTKNVFEPGKFFHVAGVVDKAAGKVRIYVNGALEGEGDFPANAEPRPFDTPWRIGIAAPGADQYRWQAHGVADEVRIYTTALSAERIKALSKKP